MQSSDCHDDLNSRHRCAHTHIRKPTELIFLGDDTMPYDLVFFFILLHTRTIFNIIQ